MTTDHRAEPAVGRRLVEIGNLLLGSTEVNDLLHNIVRGMCEVTGYERSLLVDYDQRTGLVTGRAGFGLPISELADVRAAFADVPLVAEAARRHGPIVVQPLDVDAARYARVFRVHGTLLVIPLHSDRLGLLGVLFADRAGRVFRPDPDELEVLQDFADLAALAMQNRLLFGQAADLVALRERGRLAADLHDGVTQQLFAAGLDVQEALAAPSLPDDARVALSRLSDRLSECAKHLRAALFELVEQDCVGIADTVADCVRRQIELFTRASDLLVELDVHVDCPEPDLAVRRLLLRAVAEGTANASKHAAASKVEVVVREGHGWWTVEVDDDGDGDAVQVRRSLKGRGAGFGLKSLADEAARLGGRLWVSASPGLGGVRLTVSVPDGHEHGSGLPNHPPSGG